MNQDPHSNLPIPGHHSDDQKNSSQSQRSFLQGLLEVNFTVQLSRITSMFSKDLYNFLEVLNASKLDCQFTVLRATTLHALLLPSPYYSRMGLSGLLVLFIM